MTRIERGTREVKLREAATMASCLNVDMNKLIVPQIHDPLAQALQLRTQAGSCLRAAWVGFAQLGMLVQSLTELLDTSQTTRDRLSLLRGRAEGLEMGEVVGFELLALLQELQQWVEDSEIPVDERVAGELQRTAIAAIETLFTAKGPEERFRSVRFPMKWIGHATT